MGEWSKPHYSEALGMRYSVHSDGRVATEDRTIYYPDEIEAIKVTDGEITPEVHMLKSIFRGRIVLTDPV